MFKELLYRLSGADKEIAILNTELNYYVLKMVPRLEERLIIASERNQELEQQIEDIRNAEPQAKPKRKYAKKVVEIVSAKKKK